MDDVGPGVPTYLAHSQQPILSDGCVHGFLPEQDDDCRALRLFAWDGPKRNELRTGNISRCQLKRTSTMKGVKEKTSLSILLMIALISIAAVN